MSGHRDVTRQHVPRAESADRLKVQTPLIGRNLVLRLAMLSREKIVELCEEFSQLLFHYKERPGELWILSPTRFDGLGTNRRSVERWREPIFTQHGQTDHKPTLLHKLRRRFFLPSGSLQLHHVGGTHRESLQRS